MAVKVFRWKGVGPLLVFLILLGIGWALLGDRFVEDTGEEAGTELLGTQLDISGLRIRETDASMALSRLQIANPFALDRNLVETGTIQLDLAPGALLEKKLVVNQFVMSGIRFGTERDAAARPVSGDGFAPSLLRSVSAWREQFNLPILRLSTIDSVKQLALDPERLATVRQARALVDAADSLQRSLTATLTSLDPRPVIDSATALVDRLAGANIAKLGLRGARDAAADVRRTIRAIDSVTNQVEALEQTGYAGLERLRDGVASIDGARRADYDFARSLLQLPSFEAPALGKALFGQVSIDRFQQVVYWSELAQKYLPPGLRPMRVEGPKRLRMDGTSVLFPRFEDYPSFLLRDGRLDLALDVGGARHTLEGTVKGITTRPSLYGAPALITVRGTVGGANPLTIDVGASLDHTGQTVRDSVLARLAGVRLPGFDVPGLPFRVDPGIGVTTLSFSRRGDRMVARWSLSADNARWTRDSAAPAGGTSGVEDVIETVVWRVLSGLARLEVIAELEGELTSPTLSVRSNLDEAIAAQLRTLLSEEIAKAEARVRAEVDQHIGEPIRAARSRVAAYEVQALARVAEVKQELEQAKSALEGRLRSLVLG